MDREVQFVVGAMDAEDAMECDVGIAGGVEITREAVRGEDDLGIAGAFEDVFVHFAIASPLSALAAGRIHG